MSGTPRQVPPTAATASDQAGADQTGAGDGHRAGGNRPGADRNGRWPEVSALAERVRLEVDPAAAAAFPDTLTARVTAHRRRGGPVTATAHARGTAGDHLPAGEIRAKFHRLASTAVSPAQARQIETAVLALTDDAPITDVLAPLRQR